MKVRNDVVYNRRTMWCRLKDFPNYAIRWHPGRTMVWHKDMLAIATLLDNLLTVARAEEEALARKRKKRGVNRWT